MGLLNSIRDLWNGTVAEERDDLDDYEVFDDYGAPRGGSARSTRPAHRSYERDERDYDEEDGYDSKVVQIHTTAQLKVAIVRPVHFEEVADIAKHLMNKRTVLVNLEQTSKEISRRIIDFVSGSAYALDGQLKKVANNTFIVIPFNVDLIGTDVLDELENNGVYF